ncbi:MAG TPA: hypothetical protein VJM33_02935 [Microthrixaceae bacterium]|nr:hypothetical protein [Microthrixaceae bacterium]
MVEKQEAHRGVDDLRIEEVRPQDVVVLRDPLIEVVLGQAANLFARSDVRNRVWGDAGRTDCVILWVDARAERR